MLVILSFNFFFLDGPNIRDKFSNIDVKHLQHSILKFLAAAARLERAPLLSAAAAVDNTVPKSDRDQPAAKPDGVKAMPGWFSFKIFFFLTRF